jgi:prophage maintenance system killer protein
MYVFLGCNGWSLEAPQVETILEMLALAVGELNEDQVAEWLQSRSVSAIIQ